MNVDRYQFDRIVTKTIKEIAPIKKREENGIYLEYLALLEKTLFQFHVLNSITGRQAKEILQLVLYDIKSVCDQQEYDCTQWEEEDYRTYASTIESLFFPDKNPELKAQLREDTELNAAYFELARKIIIRVYESIEQRTKSLGSEGYFNFIRDFILGGIMVSEQFLVEDRFLIQ